MNPGPDTSSSTLKTTSGRSKGRTIRREHSHNGTGSVRPRQDYEEESAMDVELTDDDEDHEAITPPSTWGKEDLRWRTPAEEGATSNLPKGVDDDDMFKAALALCGLGRRT